MQKVIVSIDPGTCISAANCIGVAPQFFQIAANPHAEVLDRAGRPSGTSYSLEVNDGELALLEEAAESCPTRAILVTK